MLSVKPAILHDYCRHRVLHADYPGIIPEKGHTVRGTYVTGLTDGDIWRLDTFEGGQYSRDKVSVVLLIDADHDAGKNEGEVVETETYVFTEGDEWLERVEWDYEVFRKEKMHRWADHSEEYQELDTAVEADNHDPTGGRGVKSDMLDKLHGKADEDEESDEEFDEDEEAEILKSAV